VRVKELFDELKSKYEFSSDSEFLLALLHVYNEHMNYVSKMITLLSHIKDRIDRLYGKTYGIVTVSTDEKEVETS
jgi:hypothetical protein